MITEVVTLEGIDLENVPPCEAYVNTWGVPPRRCGHPSAFRVYSHCTSCEDRNIFFCCVQHKEMMDAGEAGCKGCGAVRYATSML